MTSDAAPLDRLLAALREHEIPLGRDDVEWAFQSQKTKKEVAEWVTQFLGPETLLSKEEAELYSKLEKNGMVKEISSGQDLATVHPMGDSDLRAAIAALQSSTAAIEKHTETLKKQRHALDDLVDQNGTETKARKRTADKRVKKHVSEKQHADLVVEELSQSINSQLAAAQQEMKSSNAALMPAVTELLKKDDRMLAGLEKLATNEDVSKDQGKLAAKVEHLCSMLATLKTQAIQCRLDYIYLETLNRPNSANHHSSTDDEAELLSLQEELDSLYSEITPVAEMAIQQEFQGPIVHAIHDKECKANTQAEIRFEYVSSTLAYLITKLDTITAHMRDHHSHACALRQLSNAAYSELGSPVLEHISSPSKSSSPTRRQGVVREAGSPKYSSIHRSQSPPCREAEPHWQLLKSLGIHKFRGEEQDELDGILSAEVAERNGKLLSSIEGLESSIVSALTAHVGDADMALQLLLDTLYVDTQYHDVHLSHDISTAEINSLAQQVSDLGKGMSGLDLDVLQRQDKRREQFIERWS
ncbi:MAG: hypothetical protein M1835_006325 [Candelina submexicana]|nr:MAG: hypothetical protein M1835_006325 [Candelina submexicana]